MFARNALITAGLVCAASPSLASDATQAWGTMSGSASSQFAESAIVHSQNGQNAIFVEQGRFGLLPGQSLTAIGVMNSIDISGDNVTLDASQDGETSGDVQATTNIFLD